MPRTIVASDAARLFDDENAQVHAELRAHVADYAGTPTQKILSAQQAEKAARRESSYVSKPKNGHQPNAVLQAKGRLTR